MQILECLEGEQLVLNKDIVVSVTEIADGAIRLKIELPEGVWACVEDAHEAVTP